MREDLYNKQIKLLPYRRALMLIFIVCASFAHVVCAQQTVPFGEIPITPEPLGSGARALGQSAFIAVADDATAASWNPAGLTNLQHSEISLVGAWKTITKDYSPADNRVSIDQDSWSKGQVNFMSYAQPIRNTNAVISVNYHQVYDFKGEYNKYEKSDLGFFGTAIDQVRSKSEGAVSAYSLAGGFLISSYPEIAIGASFNWYTPSLFNDHAWQITQTRTSTLFSPFLPSPDVDESTYSETSDDFRGHNFTFGLLWDVYERHGNLLTLGLVYHTPFTAELDRKLVGITPSGTIFWRKDMEIDFPSSLGVGANYRISDELSVAFDVEWKEWSKLKQKFDDGTSTSPFDSDTVAYRLGCEYLLEDSSELKRACRGGLFYEERPVADYPESLPIYGLSTGLGWTAVDRYSLDFAYQFRWGEQELGNIDLDYQEHFFVASLIIYF